MKTEESNMPSQLLDEICTALGYEFYFKTIATPQNDKFQSEILIVKGEHVFRTGGLGVSIEESRQETLNTALNSLIGLGLFHYFEPKKIKSTII